jgi:hypothetical protein
VTNGDMGADRQWKTWGRMQNRSILDVAGLADLDPFFIAAHNRPEPDPDIDSELDASHDMGPRRYPKSPGFR